MNWRKERSMPFLIALGGIVVVSTIAIMGLRKFEEMKYAKLAHKAKKAKNADDIDDFGDDVSR